MTAARDLVMPKLGLTMTEGVVARWVVAPGGRFAAGEPVAVIETDKIAYDLEAPSAGILQEILVPEGSTVPVGAPIGRWDIGDGDGGADTPPASAAPTETIAEAPALIQDAAPAPILPAAEPGQRLLATPYARRLARDAKIELGGISGSGPRGRIKAMDVTRAIADPSLLKAPPRPAPPMAQYSPAASTFSAGIDVDVSRIMALSEDIARAMPPLQPRLRHFIVLAASRAIDRGAAHRHAIGLAPGEPGRSPALLTPDDCRTLQTIMACSGKEGDAVAEPDGGTLWIAEAQGSLSFICADPPPGWSACLGVGSLRAGFVADADDRPVNASIVSLTIACRAAEFDPLSAQALLGRIRQLLETPSYLLIH